MKQALYRNWRPRSFKELVGQDHVTTTLQRALKSGRISHAYLFTGPRGVGKTSAARILAHAANDLPYTEDTAHLDIIEIDAASNRRIDEIRDLRDKVAIAPAAGKYKVYIIDEVHMLTREAFNALLKTLEEPPAHTIFILATTEAHKLPETIISRTQRFEFKPLPKAQMAKHLQKIAASEKIDISPEALDLLAEFGTGSFRDSIGYLDQLSAGGGKITEEDVRGVLGLPPKKIIGEIVNQLENADAAGILNSIEQLKSAGVDAAASAAAIAQQIRLALVKGQAKDRLIKLLKQLIDVPASSRPYDLLEVCLLEAAAAAPKATAAAPAAKPSPKSAAAVIESKQINKPVLASIAFDTAMWPQVVDAAKQKAASIYTALRLAEPDYSDGVLVLKFQFPLHQKKLNQSKNKALVAELVKELTGSNVRIECLVDKGAFSPAKPQSANLETPPEAPLHSINSVFGRAEVIES